MRLAAVLVVLPAAAALGVFAVLNSFHHFDDVGRGFAGGCTPVTGVAGPADLEVDPRRRRIFVSSQDRRADDARGAVHVFDLDDPLSAGGWRDRTEGVPAAFRPLGLDYYEDGDLRRLFVVNEAKNAVELFDVAGDGGLIHLETFAERRLTSPNSVVAVGPRRFYVTNDVRPGRGSRVAILHFLARAKSGEVFFADGDTWRLAADGLSFASGLDLSPDGARLYVAETAGSALRIYDRDVRTGALTLAGTVHLPAAPASVAVDEAGAIWIGAQPKPLASLRHRADPQIGAPSAVIRLGPEGGFATVYRDDGTKISAAAPARLGAILVIAALYDDKFLICDLPARLRYATPGRP